MLYLLLPCAGTAVGRCGGETGLVSTGGVFVLLLPFTEPLSFEIVRFERE